MTDIESLRLQLASANSALFQAQEAAKNLLQQLAESQAREKVRIEKITYAVSLSSFVTPQNNVLMEALAVPSDSTALDEAIGKAQRKAIIAVARKLGWPYEELTRRVADELELK